jgi:hypothetical protein
MHALLVNMKGTWKHEYTLTNANLSHKIKQLSWKLVAYTCELLGKMGLRF